MNEDIVIESKNLERDAGGKPVSTLPHPALEFGPALPRGAALGALVRLLREAGIDSAPIDSRLLLCAALGIDHATLIRDPECPLGSGVAKLTAESLAIGSFGKRVSRSLKRFWTRAPKPRLLLRQFSTMRRGFLAKTGGFSTLGQAPGQFFARFCRACLDHPVWVSIFHPLPARLRETISPLWGSNRGDSLSAVTGPALYAADSMSSSPIPPMSRAAQSLAWNRRFANMIRVWPSMEGKTVWRPIAKSSRPCRDCWRLAV